MQSGSTLGTCIGTTVRVASAICELPGVAAIDWCDRAAACMALCHAAGAATLQLGRRDPRAHAFVPEISGVGCASSEFAAHIPVLRAGLATMFALPLPGDMTGEPRIVPRAQGAYQRTFGALEDLWSRVPSAGAIVTCAPVGTREILLWLALPPSADSIAFEHASMIVQATVPLLASRVSRVIGPSGFSLWLTVKEQEILDLLTLGKSVKQIAGDLGRSPHTIHDHVKSIHRKLGASTRGELVARALGRHSRPVAAAQSQLEPKPNREIAASN